LLTRPQVRDAADLWHVWLAKRELATRRVRSRPFTGIDPAELDLAHPRARADPPPGAPGAGAGVGVQKRQSLLLAREAEAEADAAAELVEELVEDEPVVVDAELAAADGIDAVVVEHEEAV
jgi:hypothetical protein